MASILTISMDPSPPAIVGRQHCHSLDRRGKTGGKQLESGWNLLFQSLRGHSQGIELHQLCTGLYFEPPFPYCFMAVNQGDLGMYSNQHSGCQRYVSSRVQCPLWNFPKDRKCPTARPTNDFIIQEGNSWYTKCSTKPRFTFSFRNTPLSWRPKHYR